MYADYFGLQEASFSITPDPHYLYLSQRHREALAHLLYGAGGNGGFVQLTGEVGTGKTTICRAFMEQIPEQVDLALILNPALTVVELLQTICQEFHIPLAADETSRMLLVDKLNNYLLGAHARGRRPVLMIDEAQNLSPEVLEQLRLLTNLETSKHKLLQIFLIGQPELQEMLQRKDLRQLAQRITARYHLTPLNEGETRDYIRHRLAVAGVERPLFNQAALRQIHKLTDGVPRRINMLCDRALLGAFATHRHIVDRSVVNQAAAELEGAQQPVPHKSHWFWWLLLTALLAALVWGVLVWHVLPMPDWTKMLPQNQPAAEAPPAPGITTSETAKSPLPTPEPLVPENPVPPAAKPLLLAQHTAFNQLLELWGKTANLQAEDDICLAVQQQGLRCHQSRGTWNNVRYYQLPAVLKLETQDGVRYALVTDPEQQASLLDPYWFGDFTFLWQPSPTGKTLIDKDSPAMAVQWLRQQLNQAGYVKENQSLIEQIQAFQLAEGLNADGIAGTNTLIRLNSLSESKAIPRLQPES